MGTPEEEPSRPTSTPQPRPPWPGLDRQPIGLRDVEPDQLALLLRMALGLPPERPAPGELAATLGRPATAVVRGVDAGGLIAWCLAGLAMFGEGFPTMARLRMESRRVVLALAMLRAAGNISAAARTLAMSRKVLRDNLRRVGLYPWPSDGERSRTDGQ